MLQHSAILLTFIKLPIVIRSLFCLFLSGSFTQALLVKFLSVSTIYNLSSLFFKKIFLAGSQQSEA